MSIDLTKLSPAPWAYKKPEGCDGHFYEGSLPSFPGVCDFGDSTQYYNTCGIAPSDTDAAFIALARNAFDVMMRRGWVAERFSLLGGGFAWRIPMDQANDMIRQHGANAAIFEQFANLHKWPDPFTALCAADEWYRNNVERPVEPKEKP